MWQLRKSKRGRVFSDLTTHRLKRWIKESKVRREYNLWRPGYSSWKEIGETEEFGAIFEEKVKELLSIKGIGSSRMEKLRDAGIESVDDLAKADASEISEKIEGVTEEISREWIDEAKKLVK